MATADGSFALTEVEEALLRVNEPRSCNCSGVCARKRGRGACPCKSMDEYCNRACTCGKKRACVNRLPDSTSEEDEEDRSADTSRKRSRESHESHHLTAEEMMEENERQMKEFVQQKTKEELECLTLELLRRQPGAWADLQQQLPYPAPNLDLTPAPVLHGASVVSVRICPHRQRKNAALHVKVKDASLTRLVQLPCP
ncbi:uncharacterized protein [Ptychodera flava]|uniref:uncharacterized protein n=1 Tax=Ptychodera flava TaxID=63121 RepID=UPI003969DA8B